VSKIWWSVFTKRLHFPHHAHASRDIELIVTASGLNEQIMCLALQDFAGVAEHVNRDPLHFGLLALKSASWIYIPTNYDEKWEIYMNQDSLITGECVSRRMRSCADNANRRTGALSVFGELFNIAGMFSAGTTLGRTQNTRGCFRQRDSGRTSGRELDHQDLVSGCCVSRQIHLFG